MEQISGIMYTVTFARTPSSSWEEWLVEDKKLQSVKELIQNRFGCLVFIEPYPKGVYVNKKQFTSMFHQEK